MGKERIVLATQGEGGLEDYVSPVFGRAPTYTVVDLEDGEVKGVSVERNPAFQSPMGAGIQAAQFVANLGAKVVMAGNYGPNAVNALASLGIKTISGVFNVKVKDAVKMYTEGELEKAPQYPTVPMGERRMAFHRFPLQQTMPIQRFAPYLAYYPFYGTKDYEISFLKGWKAFIEEQLKAIEKRIKELEEKK
ncbi:MAG: NifB/NifX family molybdenum-iron cluster-binding protein [Candidatus Asgardarchaeia archaeon]